MRTKLENAQRIISDIDHLIGEMLKLRRKVTKLVSEKNDGNQSFRPVRETEWFGMWAGRKDMEGISSREWLKKLRDKHWNKQ
ncbi:MAG: hypothetical protein D6814_14180 [Calditrichaeota bacterium]|nr:MAG: hypothetical protein D6814_14180 [Calditrichota bacterium]